VVVAGPVVAPTTPAETPQTRVARLSLGLGLGVGIPVGVLILVLCVWCGLRATGHRGRDDQSHPWPQEQLAPSPKAGAPAEQGGTPRQRMQTPMASGV
jgi:hypothetical protein